MWTRILKSVSSERRMAGIELHTDSTGEMRIALVLLLKKKGNIVLEKAFPITENWADLVNNLPKKTPCAVCLSGKTVFQKNVLDGHLFEKSKRVNAILPTVDPQDYYWQMQEQPPATALAAVKKEVLDSLVDRLVQYDISVQSIFLNYFSLTDFTAVLNLEGKSLGLMDAVFVVKPRQPETFTGTNDNQPALTETILLGKQEILAEMLPSYCAALDLFISTDNALESYLPPVICENIKNQHFKQLYKGMLILLGAFLLLILSINFAAYHYYFNKNFLSAGKYQLQEEREDMFQRLQQEVTKKESFFQRHGFLKPYRISQLLARVGAAVPDSVQLLSLSLFPLREHTDRINLGIQTEIDTMRIMGSCPDSGPLRAWIGNLKKDRYVGSVKVGQYKVNMNSGKAEFALIVVLK